MQEVVVDVCESGKALGSSKDEGAYLDGLDGCGQGPLLEDGSKERAGKNDNFDEEKGE